MTQAATQAATGGDDTARVSVDVTKAENEAVQAAMAQVTNLVDGIAKAAGVTLAPEPEPIPEPTTEDVDTKKGGMGTMRKMYEAEMKGMGMSGDKLKKAMEKFDKRFGQMAKTQKNADGADADAEPAADPAQALDDTVSATLDTIQKAKAFTPARIQKLTEAMETLQKLMMEVISPGSSPKTKVPGVSQHSNPNTTRSALVGTQKSADGEPGMADVLKGLDAVLARMEDIVAPQAPVAKNADGGGDLATQLQSISKRLERIEAARPAPQSEGDGDGSVTTTTTQKGFWGGII